MKTLSKHFTLMIGILIWVSTSMAQTHGMLLFGNNTTYASHLPMFHEPHNYQVILQIELSELPGGPRMPTYDTLKAYHALKASGKKLFTLAPQAFDLKKLINKQIKTFQASLYDGHFEKGGEKIGPVMVYVHTVIHAAELPGQESPMTQDYLLFGKDGEYYSSHLISSKPSFDWIAQVSQPWQTLTTKKSKIPCYKRNCDDGPFIEPLPDTSLPMVLNFKPSLTCELIDKQGNPRPFYCDLPPAVGDELHAITDFKIGDHIIETTYISTTIQDVLYLEQDELQH